MMSKQTDKVIKERNIKMKKLVIVAMAVTCAFAVVALPTEAGPLSTV